MSDILLVDDDSELVESLARVLGRLLAPYKIRASSSAAKAIEIISNEKPLAIVLDLCVDERVGVESGFELLSQIKSVLPDARVLVLTGHGALSNGVKAMSLGAASFIEKPANPEHLAALIKDATIQAELKREYERLKREGTAGVNNDLSGVSAAVIKLRDEVAFAASTTQPVLLLGETGTGKSLVAKLIHQASSRGLRRFIHYHPNYAGGDIVRSELFGHTKGAFTGAVDSRKGLVLDGNGGTLFIDELDAVPLDTQVLLLDLVQEQRIRPVGSDVYQKIDSRIIAATNRPIGEALKEGLVRQDLYHRLASNVITLPPLRERREDIPAIIENALSSLRDREGINVFGVESSLMEALCNREWPGNIRELIGVVVTAAHRARFKGRTVIAMDDLSFHAVSAPGALDGGGGASFHERVEAFKREMIKEALKKSGGNQLRAAQMLGVDRGTVKRLG
jgi:DNA-binding NtrC family response regulator